MIFENQNERRHTIMENYTILKCDESHLDTLIAFYNEVVDYLNSTVNYCQWVRDGYPARKSISRAIANQTQYLCLCGDNAAGAFILNDDPMGAYDRGSWKQTLNEGEYMVIHTLAVSPSFFQKGIGQYMVKYCLTEARKQGFKAVRLDVVPGNIPAENLYEKAGFTSAGIVDLGKGLETIPLFSLYEFNF